VPCWLNEMAHGHILMQGSVCLVYNFLLPTDPCLM